MTEKIKTLEEARALLAEYEALPDLDAILSWTGYERLPDYKFTCICGYSKTYPMRIRDLEQTIKRGWEWKLEHYKNTCCGHKEDENDDEEAEDE